MLSKLEDSTLKFDATRPIEPISGGLNPSAVSPIEPGLVDLISTNSLFRASDNSEEKHFVPSDSFSDQLLAAHNKYRSEVGIPPLNWSQTLANSAKKAADQQPTNFGHTDTTYGENIWGGTSGVFSLTQMVDDWGAEKKYFIPGSSHPNTSSTGNLLDVGHYTQIVWENTKELGCGLTSGGGFDYLVCHYNPPGNYPGQKVYTVGTATDPGNTLGTAYNIGTLSDTRTFSDWVGKTDTNDFYRFNVSKSGKIGITIDGMTAVNTAANLDILMNSVKLIRDTNNNGIFDPGEEVKAHWSDGLAYRNYWSMSYYQYPVAPSSNYFVKVSSNLDTSYDLKITMA